MPISKKRNCVICASASLSISMSTCMEADTYSRVGSPGLRRARDRRWRCSRPRIFVKVVQRLPVRIELEGYDPNTNPLFIGTSVVPYVYINKPPTGPDAGKYLQTQAPQSP